MIRRMKLCTTPEDFEPFFRHRIILLVSSLLSTPTNPISQRCLITRVHSRFLRRDSATWSLLALGVPSHVLRGHWKISWGWKGIRARLEPKRETSLLESRRYKSRLGFRASLPLPPSLPISRALCKLFSETYLRHASSYSLWSCERRKIAFPLAVVARIPTRRAAPRRADARVHGIGKIRWRGACCMYACTRTRPRSRACVHFHRRARRNCKVAYMQGVKLAAARSERIERYREIQQLQQRRATIPSTRGGQLSVFRIIFDS